ncbi:hypothetical protein EAG_13571 [Camponotus floridanus]|uniref:Uncharacterized protein n=1 Tax=Camponotus floridanus TaxID=104421 RepID=E2AM85_CAMFO|nr:hypothetical protein EAG_13571 [Camponotus floridanus]
MGNNCKPQSLARRRFSGLPGPFGQGTHADSFSVARVRPRTSKGITDLLLLNLVRLEAACPSKKICLYVGSKNPPAEAGGLRDTISKEHRDGILVGPPLARLSPPVGRPTSRQLNTENVEPTVCDTDSTTSFLTATTLIYAIGAGITAAAGTRLALQWILVKGFKVYSFRLRGLG